MYIIQVKRRFSNLRGRSLDNVVIVRWQSGSGRFAGFYPATSTPTPKKLLAMASSQSPRMEFINLSLKTLLPRSCKHRMRFDLGHFTPGRSQSAQLVIRLSSTTVPHPIGSPGQPSMHFPTLSIFVLHRPGRSSSAMVYDLDVNHPVPPLPLLKSSPPPPLILFLSLEGTVSVVTLMLVLSLISTKC